MRRLGRVPVSRPVSATRTRSSLMAIAPWHGGTADRSRHQLAASQCTRTPDQRITARSAQRVDDLVGETVDRVPVDLGRLAGGAVDTGPGLAQRARDP